MHNRCSVSIRLQIFANLMTLVHFHSRRITLLYLYLERVRTYTQTMLLTFDKAAQISRNFLERQFPKPCNNCSRIFTSLKDYLLNTDNIGQPISYDANQNAWLPRKPMGTFAMANCRCGSTLSMSSNGMPLITMWRLLLWARKESRQRDISVSELLEHMRQKIDQSVLSE